MKIAAVIMAGGSGKRFWPLSRESRAKQSLKLFSEKTLLSQTIERILPVCSDITVISSEKQKSSIDQDVKMYSRTGVIYEPSGRNTAPCIMLALRALKTRFDDCAVLVLPADHHISDPEKFLETVQSGVKFLEKNSGSIGTIGISPSYPETGFGYIQKKEAVGDEIFSVRSFEEKPSREKAELFLKSGNYLWNGGIFLFTLNTMLNDFEMLAPDIYRDISAIPSLEIIDGRLYGAIRSISFDYAIMEKTRREIFTVKGDFGWNDVGNWLSYYELLEKDGNGNASKGPAHFINSSGSLIVNMTEKTAVVFNKKRELVVITEDAMLSCSLDDHQELRKVTEYLSEIGMKSVL